MKNFFRSWLINTLAVLVAAYVIKGIHYDKPLALLVASLLLGILNTILRPILMLLALPVLLLTLGLFYFVINGLILYFVGWLLRPHFYVDGFWDAFWGALIIGLVSVVLNTLTGGGKSRSRAQRPPPPADSGPGGSGPVIDV